MKRILLFLFIITSGVVYGQGGDRASAPSKFSMGKGRTDLYRWFDNAGRPAPIPPGYTKINARYEWIAGLFDTALHVPGYNGTPSGVRVGAWVGDGAIAMDTTNHRFYIYSGGAWVRLAAFSEIGSTTYYNSNVGSGYRWVIPNTNNIKTLLAGTNITIDSSVANTLTINASTAASTVPISGLTAATGTNTINNGNFKQSWDWDGLVAQGLTLNSNGSSTTSSADNTLLQLFSYGANANASVGSTGIDVTVGRTGTTATNVAGRFSASSGTNNYAIIVPSQSGSVGIGTSAPTSLLHVVGEQTTGIGAAFSSSTITTGTLIDLTATGTARAAGNEVLNIVSSGLNATNAITVTGGRISVTNTNATSGTNIGLDITASGATTNNLQLVLREPAASGTNYTAFKTQAQAADIVYTLPATVGGAATVLTDAAGDGILSWAAGGGGTPAGNFGNLQINRNGAFATPGSDSLDFESATGLTVKGNITSSTLTSGRIPFIGASGLIKDDASFTYDGDGWISTTAGGAGTGGSIISTNASGYSSLNFITTLGGTGFQIGKYGPTGTVSNGVFFYNPDNSATVFTQNGNRILDITGAGNLLLGGTTDPASAYYTIGLHNGGAPTGSITNGVIIYSEDVAASAELKVRDEAGNITVLSPHHFEGIPMGKSEDMAWSYYSERDGKYITVDMLKAIRTIEDLTRRVEKLEKELNMKSKKPVKLVYTGKVKAKKPVPINKQP